MNRIFLLGSERSGSNLLRSLIGNHTEVSAPIAPHFCDVFFRYAHRYGFLPNGDQMLLQDLVAYANHPFNDWHIDISEVSITRGRPISFLKYLDALYTAKMLTDGKTSYFSKDNHNHRYALGILNLYPGAKFLYLYRDPRDQVASWLRTPVHLHSARAAANVWVEDQRACLGLSDFYGLNFLAVKYEDLVDNPEAAMTKVLEFSGLDVQAECFQTKSENPEARKHKLWENLDKPVLKGNYKKYREVLSEFEVAIVEKICDIEMTRLGYPKETSIKIDFNGWPFRFRERWLAKRVKARSASIRNSEMGAFNDKQTFLREMFKKFEQ